MSAAQIPRVDSRFADYEGDSSDGHTPKAGVKRTFSDRYSRRTSNVDAAREYFEDAVEEVEYHSEKRYRSAEWPLPNTFNDPRSSASPSNYVRSRNSPRSATRGRTSLSQQRPSRFVEGSMNDRVSKKPPTPYLDDEELRQKFEREEHMREDQARGRKFAQPRKFTQHANHSVADSRVSHSDNPRHSTIFKFGKSIAATFNPTNWKIWAKPQPEVTETPEHKVMRERQEKAETIYKELKRNGQFRDSTVPPSFKPMTQRDLSKHDSGIAFSQPRASVDTVREKRQGKIYLETPQFDESGVSPGSRVESATGSVSRKGGFRMRRPSLSKIMKPQGSDIGCSIVPSSGDHQARRIPSRKDLQKQQKLVKRVSDLEMKLDAARRQLSDAIGQPMPMSTPVSATPVSTSRSQPTARIGRPRFVPGALATLPSERLLAGYVPPDDEEEVIVPREKFELSSPIGRAIHVRDSSLDSGSKAERYGRGSLDSARGRTTGSVASSKARDEQRRSAAEITSSSKAVPSGETEMADNSGASTSSDELASPHEHKIPIKGVRSRHGQIARSRDLSREPTTTPALSHVGSVHPEPTRAAPKPPISTEPDKSHATATSKSNSYAYQQPKNGGQEYEHVNELAPRSNKRKAFEGFADDGGEYMPTSDEDEDEMDFVYTHSDAEDEIASQKAAQPSTVHSYKIRKTITLKKKIPARREEPATPHANKSSSPHNQRQSANRYQKPSRASGSAVSRAPSKLTKTPQHDRRTNKLEQAISTPPPRPSANNSLDYRKPSSRADVGEHVAVPGEDDVPALPPLPKTVRLASGEIVNTSTAPRAKLSKKRRVAAEEHDEEEDGKGNDDEWPAYVF